MTRPISPARFKALCDRHHARRRAAERHGLDLSGDDLTEIERRIGSGIEAGCLPLQVTGRANRTTYAVLIEGRWYPVVYDPGTCSVVTFLPDHALVKYRDAIGPDPADSSSAEPAGSDGGPDGGPVASDDLPDTIAEIDGRVAEIAEARKVVLRKMKGRSGADLEGLHAVLAELKAEERELLGRKYAARIRAGWLACRMPDPADPRALLKAATMAICRMRARLGPNRMTPDDQGVLDVVRHYLSPMKGVAIDWSPPTPVEHPGGPR